MNFGVGARGAEERLGCTTVGVDVDRRMEGVQQADCVCVCVLWMRVSVAGRKSEEVDVCRVDGEKDGDRVVVSRVTICPSHPISVNDRAGDEQRTTSAYIPNLFNTLDIVLK